MAKNTYKCKNCGFVLNKKDAKTSGFDSQNSMRHIHCPQCGKTITHNP